MSQKTKLSRLTSKALWLNDYTDSLFNLCYENEHHNAKCDISTKIQRINKLVEELNIIYAEVEKE